MNSRNLMTGYTENGPSCETLRVYGLAKCHPQSCDECPNYVPAQPKEDQ